MTTTNERRRLSASSTQEISTVAEENEDAV
jgi:hypothetical protein